MATGGEIWRILQELDRLVFTTREIAALTGTGLSAASQGLKRLEAAGVLRRAMQGVWALAGDRRFSAFALVPYLNPNGQAYVSFLSAMHIHGMLSQIPKTITVASTAHARLVVTPVATFQIHQIGPEFFDGFEWSANGRFLIATPEKALVDSLYIASRRGRRYSSFPEIELPRGFSKLRARSWLGRIRSEKLRASVAEKLGRILGA